MDLTAASLALAVAAFLISGFAAWRAYVPPARRELVELRGRLDDVEHQADELQQRITVRARKEGMAETRERHEQRAQRRQLIEEEAAELILNSKRPAPADPRSMTKQQLRALYLPAARKQ